MMYDLTKLLLYFIVYFGFTWNIYGMRPKLSSKWSKIKKKSVSNYCKPLVHMSFDIVIIRDVVMLILKKKSWFRLFGKQHLEYKTILQSWKKWLNKNQHGLTDLSHALQKLIFQIFFFGFVLLKKNRIYSTTFIHYEQH